MDAEKNSGLDPHQTPKLPYTKTIWLGIGAGLLTGLALLGLEFGIVYCLASAQAGEDDHRSGDATQMWLWGAFIIIPFCMGYVMGLIWSKLRLSTGKKVINGLLATVLAIGLAANFLHEGVICLIMASPLLIIFLLTGVSVGTHIGNERNNRLRVSVLPLLATLVVIDAFSPHHYTNAVTDTITIHAPAAKVWPLLASYPAIKEKPDYWLWRIGLPCPVQSVSVGAFVGASRECRFTDGVTIGERIIDVTPDKRLAFDITRQPDNPEVMGHLVLKRGEFDLTDNGNGTCTLSGTSWYTLNVYPSWYYDLWTQDIVRHVHMRVMEHIKLLAEAG